MSVNANMTLHVNKAFLPAFKGQNGFSYFCLYGSLIKSAFIEWYT